MESINIRKEKLEGIIEKIITIKEQSFVTCLIKNNTIQIIYPNKEEKEIKLKKYIFEIMKELKKDFDKKLSISNIKYNNTSVTLYFQ